MCPAAAEMFFFYYQVRSYCHFVLAMPTCMRNYPSLRAYLRSRGRRRVMTRCSSGLPVRCALACDQTLQLVT